MNGQIDITDFQKRYKYTESDVLAANHFLIFGDKAKAYMFSRPDAMIKDKKSLYGTSVNYFKTDKIKQLLGIESQKIRDNIHKLHNRIGLNNNESKNEIDFNSINFDQIANIDRDKAIKILEHTINANKTDSKTLKELIPQLIKLKEWDKKTENKDSNILFYELPRKD